MVGDSRKGKGPAGAKKGKSNTKVPKPRPHSSKRPKNYRRFDELTKNLRESLITTCAKTYFKHVDANGGSCARGFVDSLLTSVREKAVLLDITKDDLVINDEDHRWLTMLGAPYGTVEIVIPLREAIMNSFMRTDFGKSALAVRGCYPFNRAPLDHPQILASAPEDVQKERAAVLQSRGAVSDISVHVPSSQRNLLETGSGRLAGGAAAAQEVVEAAQTLNATGSAASDILTLKSSLSGTRV